VSPWLGFGALRRPHGTRGEILLAPYNPDADRGWTATLPVRIRWVKAEQACELEIVALRPVKDGFLVRFASPATREALADLVGGEVQLARQRLPELSVGEFYVEDVVGWEVCRADGTRLGNVRGSYWNGAYDVMSVVADDGEERFVPMLPGFVLSVDTPARRLTVDAHE
jgi:16S rRNA processing protein RimM